MDWKSEFYSQYSSTFRRKIDESSFRSLEPYARYIVRKCFPADKNARVLDLGCGFGGFLKTFIKEGYTNVEGIDLSGEDVAYAHQFGVTQVRQGDIMKSLEVILPGEYDIVLFLDILEHLEQGDVLKVMREAYRILRPGGCVIIHVPNAEGIFGSRIRYSDFTHQLAFTNTSLIQVATFAGFRETFCYEDKPLTHKWSGWIRRIIWEIATLPYRILHGVETGVFRVRLSQNILFKTTKA